MMLESNKIENKLIRIENSESLFKSIRKQKKTIGLCHGVFDLLHPGHLRHLAKAKEKVDLLFVSITADQFVNKGPGRPAFTQDLRAESLANIISVDYVLISPFPTAVESINAIKPDFYFKGNDYSNEKSDATGNITLERKTVESFGGRVVNTDEIVFSSSELINKFLSSNSTEVTAWLNNLKSKFSIDEILGWLEKISKLKVLIIGESIIDTYTDCDALGKSSKDPILCFNRGQSQSFAGGVLAIGAHCQGLGLNTTIVTGINHKDKNLSEIKNLLSKGVKIDMVDIAPHPTIRKERFVDTRTSSRVLELYEMDDSPLPDHLENDSVKLIADNIKHVDLVIIADYGHGFISDKIIQHISSFSKFTAVNVQTNAGNRGFNSLNRYSNVNFITLNGVEAQLEMRRKHFEINALINDLREKTRATNILITRGNEGIDFYPSGNLVHKAPALAPFVKDRVGAGDALLSITSLLVSVGAPTEIVTFYGNLVGAWAVSFIGNEKSLEQGLLFRQVASLLK
jgi:rfaE bifunctional protein kinase chain/domain/rfaE bifunctional protein nucleotidyltransferase chain/domain